MKNLSGKSVKLRIGIPLKKQEILSLQALCDVFSCCGLMRLSRVHRPYKQNPSAEKMPGYPRPPYQEIWLDKKQTQVQALASRPRCILHQSTKHKVVQKRWHFSCTSPQISHTNKKGHLTLNRKLHKCVCLFNCISDKLLTYGNIFH